MTPWWAVIRSAMSRSSRRRNLYGLSAPFDAVERFVRVTSVWDRLAAAQERRGALPAAGWGLGY